MKKYLFIFLPFMGMGLALHAQSKKQPIKVTDLLLIKSAGDVAISPDGKFAVYTVNGKSLYEVNLTGTATPQMLDSSANAPTYSPSGQEIAFVKNGQIYIYHRADHTSSALPKFRYGAGNPAWSPDGKQLLFSAAIPLLNYVRDSILNPTGAVPKWADGKPGFKANTDLVPNHAKPDADGDIQQIRAYLALNETDKKAKVFSRLQFQGETNTSSEIKFSHIFITDTAANALPVEVTKGFYSFSNPVFINAQQLIVTGKINDQLHPDEAVEEQVYAVQLDGTFALKPLLSAAKKAFTVAGISASGRYLAYQQSFPGTVNVPTLHIRDLTTNQEYAIPVDRSLSKIEFTADESQLYFVAQQNGGAALYRGDWRTGKFSQLTSVDEGINDYDLKGNTLVYAKTNVQNPSELYKADAAAKNEVLLTALNTAWLSEREISTPQKVVFKNSAGLDVECWIMKPVGFEAGKKYPLLLDIHGGPASMWGPGDFAMWHEYQYYCAKGIGVVYANPRGSGGYGEKFLQANKNDWGPGPYSDVMTALNKAIGQGWADTTKLLVSGGSYGGYMTAWIISHNHRFLAASAQRGVYDFHTFFGEGNVWRIIPRYYEGYPFDWDAKGKLLHQHSPIHYVNNIKTPLLIFSGESDLRVGQSQSEMLYKTLKVLGRPVEYVQQPGASHELVRSGDGRQRIDQLLRTYEFFERYLSTPL